MSRSRSPRRCQPLRLAATGDVLTYAETLKKACEQCLQKCDDDALTVCKLTIGDRVVSADSPHMPGEVKVVKIAAPSPKPGTLRLFVADDDESVPDEKLLVLGPESMDTIRGEVKWVKTAYKETGFQKALSLVSCNKCHAFTTTVGAVMHLWYAHDVDSWTCYDCEQNFDFHCGRCHFPIYAKDQDTNVRRQEDGLYWCGLCSVTYGGNFTGC